MSEAKGLVMLSNAGDKILPVSAWKSGGDTVSFQAGDQAFSLTQRQILDLVDWIYTEETM